ncbi:hypothetical protein BY996DRAFT_6414074 [Phakopsora pachyrhizi]|nr:hypothetical protein BY996DRAFT_6414074 [Phakopsora pachyrhizi]
MSGTSVNRTNGSLDFFEASTLNSGSHSIDLNHPTPQPSNLIDSSIGEGVLEIPIRKCFRNHESNTGSLKLARFDLNELPEDTGSELSHKLDEEISELGSYRDHGQTSKSQTMESALQSPTDSKPSSVDTGHVSMESASDQDQSINESEILRDTRDFYTYQVPKNKSGRRYDQKDKNQHSSKRFKKKNTPPGKKILNIYAAQSRKRKNPDGSNEKDLSMDSEVKGRDEMSIFIKKRVKYKVKNSLSTNYLKYFITSLSAKVKNPGPFDMQGEKTYRSPYNSDLLGFIDKNLEKMLPSELGKIKISKIFFETIKNIFWNNVEGLFFLSEEKFSLAILSVDSNSHLDFSQTWIHYSRNLHKTSSSASAAKRFHFSTAFSKFLKYEKLSRFFLNDEMRQTAITGFFELNSRLLESTSDNIHTRKGINGKILKQTWSRMTSFLAYVHAFNAIIAPGDTKPLSYHQLLQQQKDAIEFFFQLHNKVESLRAETRATKVRYVIMKPFNDKSDFEEEKQKLMKKIFSSHLRSDNAPWLYIELWMMNFRPSLYNIMKSPSLGEKKFRSLANRVFFILFSGMYSYTKLIKSNQSIR